MGNEILFDGKKYISARRAAQITGYNSDYIGQLCRKGALDCKLVGRAWFVGEKSLEDHKNLIANTPRTKGMKSVPHVVVMPSVPVAVMQAAPIKNEAPTTVPAQEKAQVQIPTQAPTHEKPTQIKIPSAYDHQAFVLESFEHKATDGFAKKVTALSIVIFALILSVPFFLQSNPAEKFASLFERGDRIAQEINSGGAEKLAALTNLTTVANPFASVEKFFTEDSRVVREWRVKAHQFNLSVYHRLSTLPEMFFNTAGNMKKIVMRTADEIMVEKSGGEERAGITVVPSTGNKSDDEKLKQYIKDSFSDETEVVPDETGTSGVIKPVFKKNNGDEYLYVIVPIKE